MTKEQIDNISQQIQFIRMALATIPAEALEMSAEKAERDETIGPLLDPSAWQNGKKFDEATRVKKAVDLLLKLKEVWKGDEEAFVAKPLPVTSLRKA